jgi:hypothetical protein
VLPQPPLAAGLQRSILSLAMCDEKHAGDEKEYAGNDPIDRDTDKAENPDGNEGDARHLGVTTGRCRQPASAYGQEHDNEAQDKEPTTALGSQSRGRAIEKDGNVSKNDAGDAAQEPEKCSGLLQGSVPFLMLAFASRSASLIGPGLRFLAPPTSRLLAVPRAGLDRPALLLGRSARDARVPPGCRNRPGDR